MRLCGHRFMNDGHLEIDVEQSGHEAVVTVDPDVVRGGSNRLVPILLALLERARQKFEEADAIEASREKETTP